MVVSPCSGVCEIDTAVALCRGCARSLDEIARWSETDEADRQRIIDTLPARMAQLRQVP